MIKVSNLHAHRGSFSLVNVNFEVPQGSILTFVGPNGCGKTTLLECIAGLQKIKAGKIVINGVDVTNLPPEKRKTGYVPDDYALFPNMTVRQNIYFGAKKAEGIGPSELSKIPRLLRIENLMERNVESLSSGEKQRVALARALASKPAVLLLDEPCSALDPPTKEMLKTQIKDVLNETLREVKVPVIYTTHDLIEASVISDKIAVMNNGRIVQIGFKEEIFENPNSKFVSEFLGYNVLNGRVISAEDGKVSVEIGGVILEAEGYENRPKEEVTIVIRPQDIILSPNEEIAGRKWKHCRCNMLNGTVEKMYTAGSSVKVEVNIGGANLKAEVSQEWLDEFNIKVGSKIYAQIKASKVKLLTKTPKTI
ncbi:MAG: ABC transporter ATP-binding protein [Nitrososphaerota archaeon]|nr:ABC transporter ATP-binding protein [Candidatus Bathyarchaeota archaeon]MDW8023689.1 ABC transporter ATP-binding protein [Nitrososphaerota archaeon]